MEGYEVISEKQNNKQVLEKDKKLWFHHNETPCVLITKQNKQKETRRRETSGVWEHELRRIFVRFKFLTYGYCIGLACMAWARVENID